MAVALASILIFQTGSFGNTISPSSTKLAESQFQEFSFNIADDIPKAPQDVSNSVIISEREGGIEFQQAIISCLQASKPNCAPTDSETSEFFDGDISIKIVLPDNLNPQSTESWTPEELQQIMELFGLRAIKHSGQPLSQLEKASNEIQQVVSSGSLAGDILGFWFTNFNTSIGPPGTWTVVSTRTEIIEQSLSQTVIRGNMILQRGCCEFRTYEFEIDLEAEKVEDDFGEFEFIQYSHDCGIGSPVAHFGVNVCGLHTPLIEGTTESSVGAGPSRIWINAVMNAIDAKYSDTQDNFVKQVRKYANDIRERKDTDWAIVVFIVDASNDQDGMFAQSASVGSAAAWSQVGGPFMVLSNRLGGYGFDNFDKIFLHEFLHQFYALDEYQGSFDENSVSGYLGIRNENHEDATGGPFTGDPSIMKRLQIVLSPNDFITERSPACPGHWKTDPHCEVLVNGNRIGATMDVTPPSCQPNRALTRGCFEVDWHNDQNFNGPAPFFWFHSITVDPQGSLKPGETYRFGRYYLVNPIGTTFPLGRAAIEVYTDSGTLIASRDLNRTTQFDTNSNAIFEFQSIEFTIPNGTNRIDIFFARCFAAPNESCSIVAYDDFTLIGDWVFRNEIDDFALRMLGFNDEDGDGLIDPIDTAPDLKIDNFGPQPIALQVVVDNLNTCAVAISSVGYFFSHWEAEDVNLSHSLGSDCSSRTVVNGLIVGPNPTVTPVFEGPASCPPPCLPPTPQSTEDLEEMEINNSFNVGNTVQGVKTPTFLKIRAFDVTNSVDINGVRVKVFPPDLTGATDGITPFTRIYAVGYNVGVSITGHAFDVPRQNMNPIGSGNSVTINDIINLQYCLHEVSTCNWLDANPSDGAFNQAGESFNFIPNVKPGLNTITLRAINTVGNLSNLFTTNLLVLPSECVGKTFAKVIVGTEQNDVLLGTLGADLILGLEGNDEIRGKARADCLLGGDGNDIIYGNRGADAMLGAEGDDTLLGGAGNDKLDGGDDFDTCKGGAGTNTKKNCEA